MRRICTANLMVVAIVCLFPSIGDCSSSWQVEAARGIKGIRILVGDLSPIAEELGLSREQLKTDLGLKLRLAGLRLISDSGEASPSGLGRP